MAGRTAKALFNSIIKMTLERERKNNHKQDTFCIDLLSSSGRRPNVTYHESNLTSSVGPESDRGWIDDDWILSAD